MELDRVVALLEEQEWTFAKTMPDQPHWYTLRKNWKSAEEFEAVVLFIREHGVAGRWPPNGKGGAEFIYLVANGFKYWTMGAAVDATILINRAVADEQGPKP